MKNKRTGRPPLAERLHLSDREKQYCKLRASGLSITAAAQACGKRAKSMEKAERQWPLLKAQIDIDRVDKVAYDVDESSNLRMRILRDLHGEVTNLLIAGKLSLPEIDKAYSLLRSMESDLNSLMLQAKKAAPKSNDDHVIADFPGFMKKVGVIAAKYIDCPVCAERKKKIVELPLPATEGREHNQNQEDYVP